MANVKKGQLSPAPQWWKHLRWTKRAFWKAERQAVKEEVARQKADDDGPRTIQASASAEVRGGYWQNKKTC